MKKTFKTTTIINEEWSNYDKKVAKSHLFNYGKIYLDEYDCPIDNEFDLEEIVICDN